MVVTSRPIVVCWNAVSSGQAARKQHVAIDQMQGVVTALKVLHILVVDLSNAITEKKWKLRG